MLNNYPIFYYIAAALFGLVLAEEVSAELPINSALYFLTLFLLILVIGIWFKPLQRPLGLLTVVVFFFSHPNAHPPAEHYSHQVESRKWYRIAFQVEELHAPNAKYNRYWAQIKQIDQSPSEGKVQIYSRKGIELHPGYHYQAIARYSPLNKPYSPVHFDFETYRKRQGVHGSFYLDTTQLPIESKTKNVLSTTYRLRKKLMHGLDQRGLSTENAHVLAALLWGERTALSENTQENYRKSGAVHVLSVSGLHVSIIAGFVYFFIGRLVTNRWLKWTTASIILLLFSAIAGFSPTVNRATLQFCLLGVAPLLGRHSNSLAVIALSFFLLLVGKPTYLWDIGFQLSYAAVLGIVTCFPIWRSRFRSASRWKNALSNTIGVSLIAQLFTLPLSLYYFHQFPGLFLVTNLVILPWISGVMAIGLFVCILNLFQLAPDWSIQLLEWSMEWQNRFIAYVAQFQSWHWEHLYFREKELLLGFLILTAFLMVLNRTMNRRKQILFGSIVILVWVIPWNAIPAGWYITPSLGSCELLHINDHSSRIWTTRIQPNEFRDQALFAATGQAVKLDSLPYRWTFQNKTLLRVDKKGNDHVPACNLLWLTQNAGLHLAHYLERYKPEIVIADGSSRPALREKWKATCAQKKIPFHDTTEKGFYKLD